MKKITCPHCGNSVAVSGLGRKALNMPVINVCDALQTYHSVTAAAERLRCSRALIYKVLKANGMTSAEVTKRKVTV